ncbi:MAG: hypothetical protein ACI4UU_00350 [Clostridia bacterium]
MSGKNKKWHKNIILICGAIILLILGTAVIGAMLYFPTREEFDVAPYAPYISVLMAAIFYGVGINYIRKVIERSKKKIVSLNTIRRLQKNKKMGNIVFSMIPLILGIVFAFFAVLPFILDDGQAKKSIYVYIAEVIELIIAGALLCWFINSIKRKYADIDINDLIIEEDYVYDRDYELSYIEGHSGTYYIYLKLNGKVATDWTIEDTIEKDDIMYVIKNNINNEIITIYKKDDVILSDELANIVKRYDIDYINKKFNQRIEE